MVNVGKYTIHGWYGWGFQFHLFLGTSALTCTARRLPSFMLAKASSNPSVTPCEQGSLKIDGTLAVTPRKNLHQGKSRWHSYPVFVYISPIWTYLLGTVPCTLTMGYMKPKKWISYKGVSFFQRGNNQIPCLFFLGGCNKWGYGPVNTWPSKWVTGVQNTLRLGVITPFTTGRGPSCSFSEATNNAQKTSAIRSKAIVCCIKHQITQIRVHVCFSSRY